ncbi:spore germination protein [Paenibacillus sp. cl141a]|uniref:spore germination protein n=1 Tax=Paenibacillus sp. cl141a TaxID=1761877 RepID=UPI0008B94A36|nr:spore germination protein [Paenibacillus sp. cl141a]SEL23001.1 spore germination protein [Paenibacillus sp. cl141a]
MSSSNINPNDQITTAQAAVMIINYMLGAGVLTLPRTTVEAAKTPDVWISILISAFIILLAGFIVIALCRRFQGKTWFQFVPEITGKGLAFVLSLLFIGYFVIISAFEIRVMAEVTGLYLLEGTPVWAIIMTFMWIGLYLTLGGINCIARMYEIILPITLVFFVIAILLSIKIFDINNLRPVLGSGFMPVLKGVKPSLLSFTGYEIMFVAMAFMNSPKKGTKAMIVGITVPMVIYLITVIMVIGGLSIHGVQKRTWPTLDLMRSFEMQGLIFERFESLLLVIWIMQIFSTFTITHYAASIGWSQLLKKNIRPILFILLPIIFLIAMIPKDVTETFKLGDTVGNISIYLFGALPLILLLISIARKKGVKPN